MKESIKLVILPFYEIPTETCYDITFGLKNISSPLDLVWLESNLSSLIYKYNIDSISIEGNDLSKSSEIYFDVLFKLLKTYTKKLTISSDFKNYNKALINGADIIDVLYNFNNFTEDNIEIKNNIKAAIAVGKIINIKSLDISVEKDELEVISELNKIGIKSWKIIPYQQTKNSLIPFKGNMFFESIVKKYLKLVEYMQFSFINKLQIDNVIENNNFPINTVYITFNNKFGLGCFDKNNNYFIQEYNTLDELENYLKIQQSQQILICDKCKFKKNCLADRYFNPNDIKLSCSGYKNLIKQNKGN